MRKIALIGLLLALSAGCGRGWLPSLRGASCGRCLSAPALPAPQSLAGGCSDCTNGNYGAGYSGYDSGEIVSDSGYYGNGIITGDYPLSGQIIDGGYPNEGTLVPPSTGTAN